MANCHIKNPRVTIRYLINPKVVIYDLRNTEGSIRTSVTIILYKEERDLSIVIGLFLIQQINNIITGAFDRTAIAGLYGSNWKGSKHGTRNIKSI